MKFTRDQLNQKLIKALQICKHHFFSQREIKSMLMKIDKNLMPLPHWMTRESALEQVKKRAIANESNLYVTIMEVDALLKCGATLELIQSEWIDALVKNVLMHPTKETIKATEIILQCYRDRLKQEKISRLLCEDQKKSLIDTHFFKQSIFDCNVIGVVQQ